MGSSESRLNDKFRENKRQVNRTIRELERQKVAAEREEQALISRLKSEARAGKMNNVKVMARDIVRNRKLANHYCNMKSQMLAVLSQLQTAHSTNILSSNYKNVSMLMSKVSSRTNITEFQKIMQNISREGEMLNLKIDVMSETMDDTLNDSVEEEDVIVNQLLEELGLDVADNLKTAVCPPTPIPNLLEKEDDESLEDRINNLRR